MPEKMSRAAMDAKNEYQRRWRQKNPEKVKEANKRYRAAHPEEVRERNERYWLKVAERYAAERAAEEQEAADGNSKT